MKSILRSRGAFTLVELLVVVMVAGILASSCAVVLRQAYLVQRNSLVTVAKMRSLELLRWRWTDDVQAAVSATVGESVDLRMADGSSVVYSISGGKIERQKIVNGKTIGRDAWGFSEPVNVQWAIDTTHNVPLVSMKLTFEDGSGELAPWTFLARLMNTPPPALAAEVSRQR